MTGYLFTIFGMGLVVVVMFNGGQDILVQGVVLILSQIFIVGGLILVKISDLIKKIDALKD